MYTIDPNTPVEILSLQSEYESSITQDDGFSELFYYELIDKFDNYEHHRDEIKQFLDKRHLNQVDKSYWQDLVANALSEDINLSQFNEILYLIAIYYSAQSKDEKILIKLLDIANMPLDLETFAFIIEEFINENYTNKNAKIVIEYLDRKIHAENFANVYYSVVGLTNILTKQQLLDIDEKVILSQVNGKSAAVYYGLIKDMTYYLLVSSQFHLLSGASQQVIIDCFEDKDIKIDKNHVVNFEETVAYAKDHGIKVVAYDSDAELEKIYQELGLEDVDYDEDDIIHEDVDILNRDQYQHDSEDDYIKMTDNMCDMGKR